MQQLTGLDAIFLHLETDEMPMHVGALHVFELPDGFRGRFVAELRRHIKERLPLTPALRRRVWSMPLNLANPAWVDAEPDLRKHVVEVRLPASAKRGSGFAEMEAMVARLHAVRLDRSRPLWKFHVLEGLGPSADGLRRVGLYTQLHHAAVDGQAAVALANVLFDTSPEGRDLALRPTRRQRVFRLEMTEMLRGALAAEAQQVARIVRELPSTLDSLKSAAVQVLANTGVMAVDALGGAAAGGPGRGRGRRVSNLVLAPRTPMNVSITAERAFASVSLPLPELKLLAKAHEITLNDVVLMLCATALRRYLARRQALPKQPLLAAVPVTLREAGDERPDNQATMSFVSLGTHLADPAKRLAWIRGATASMKSTMGSLKNVMPVDYPSIGVPWLMEAAVSLYGRMKVADRLPTIANVIISNVPGPAVPLYLAGARMLANRPTSIVVHGCALNITVQSYDRVMEFGLMAGADALPDVRVLADSIEIALDELRALPLPEVVRRRSVRSALTDAMADTVGQAAKGVARAAVREAVGGPVGRTVTKTVSRTVDSIAKAAKVAGQPGAIASIRRLTRR